MIVVTAEYRKTKEEITEMLNQMQEIDITPEVLLMIDFAYHNGDNNYDSGLSFLDRLHRKLSIFFPIQWNVENLKTTVRNANDPAAMFLDILNEILTDEMIAVYGV